MTQTPTPKGDEEQEMTVTFQDRNTLRASFEKILGADPVCGGRVSSSAVERLVDAANAGQGYGRGVRDAAAVARAFDLDESVDYLEDIEAAILALAAPLQNGEG